MIVYRIACRKEVSVAEVMEISSGSLQWNLNFIRATHDWEVIMGSQDLCIIPQPIVFHGDERNQEVDKLFMENLLFAPFIGPSPIRRTILCLGR